jgi:hypothetical protein
MTLALQTRKTYRWTPEYLVTYYIENVGVWPDLPDDYMTKDNLLSGGAPFVANFLAHTAAYVRGQK